MVGEGVRVLDRGSLLARLPDADRERILAIGLRRRYRKGDHVFHAGDRGESLHLILRGRAAVQLDSERGETTILTFLGEGACFGELAMVRGGVRSASVVAVEQLETLTIGRDELDQVDDGPAVQRFLIEVLAAQVDRLTARVLEASSVPAEGRVVLRLAELLGVFDSGVVPIVVPVTQTVLAGLADTTRPTANRALGGLAAAGLVCIRRGAIEVLEPDRVAALARASSVRP